MMLMILAATLTFQTPDMPCRVRAKDGHLVRSKARLRTFRVATGYPNGRPGYVIDHVISLRCGGCDLPSNYAWQTVEEAKAKDKWEGECMAWADGTNLRLLQGAH